LDNILKALDYLAIRKNRQRVLGNIGKKIGANCQVQVNPENRPDIRYVETRLIGMISGSNIVFNHGQQKNEDNDSLTDLPVLI
jgi:hypothetical protein